MRCMCGLPADVGAHRAYSQPHGVDANRVAYNFTDFAPDYVNTHDCLTNWYPHELIANLKPHLAADGRAQHISYHSAHR